MTDRVKGAYVSFDHDIRIDDVETVLNAIRMIRGVSDVTVEGLVTNPDDYFARDRVANETLDVTQFVIRSLLTGETGYCTGKAKVTKALEKILADLKEKK